MLPLSLSHSFALTGPLPMMAVLRWLALGLYLVAGLVAIYLLFGHPYEWMIGESSPGEPAVTYFTLPAPSDSTFDVGVVVTAFFVLAGLGIAKRRASGSCLRRAPRGCRRLSVLF